MTTTTMSITRALATVKHLNDRITRAIQSGTFVLVTIGQDNNRKLFGSGAPVSQGEAAIKSSFDTVDSLLRNRTTIKSLIIRSNAMTEVEVRGERMTVAEAIELKSTLPLREAWLAQLRNQLLRARQSIESGNMALDNQIEKLLTAVYGSDKAKIDASAFESVAGPQRATKVLALLDTGDIERRIAHLEEEVSVLKSEIDFVLSESNARTTIEVDL